MHQRALHVAELDMPVLARRRREDLGRGDVVPFTLEARSAHLAQEQVAKDDEGPCPHVRAGLEALPRRPGLQQGFLDKIVGEVFEKRRTGAELPISQQQLASMTGVGLRITNRVLNEARQEGILETGKRRIVINDWSMVRRRAGLRFRSG